MNNWLIWVHSSHLRGWDTDFIGYFASALVLATFLMKSMTTLRVTALMSNAAFIAYAVSADMRPILILHSLLLPINMLRLAQVCLVPARVRRKDMPMAAFETNPASIQYTGDDIRANTGTANNGD